MYSYSTKAVIALEQNWSEAVLTKKQKKIVRKIKCCLSIVQPLLSEPHDVPFENVLTDTAEKNHIFLNKILNKD